MKLRCAVGWLVVWVPSICTAAGLRPETLKAWNEYVQQVDLRQGNGPFLWMDQDPLRAARARQGEILADSEVGADVKAVPYGAIHDWVGAVFLPGVTLAQVFAVLQNYDRYREYYSPTVIDAALLWRNGARNGDQEGIRVRYSRKVLFVSEVLDSEYEVRHVQVDAQRWYSVAQSTRLREVSPAGSPGDEESRYVWRIYNISRYAQRDGGVYLEQESIVLSRAIPGGVRWLVQPAIRQLSRELIVTALRQTRNAVDSAAMADCRGPVCNGVTESDRRVAGFGSARLIVPVASGPDSLEERFGLAHLYLFLRGLGRAAAGSYT
jgi:hypothetical protein